MEIEVKGHSGCQIDVVNDTDGKVYVYKSTADPKYLQRLALQAEKQQVAAKTKHQHIRVPGIFAIKRTDKTTIVKMEYVYSRNFIEFFEQAGFEQVNYLIAALKSFVEWEISQCEMTTVSADVFRTKFAEIAEKVSVNPLYKGNEQIADVMQCAEKVFDELANLTIPVGTCHGDLTFSNILFNGNNYYLIDFLDSFIETPLQDIVKLRQDTRYRWSQLMYTKEYDAMRLSIVLDKIDAAIDAHFSAHYDWYRQYVNVMQLMNMLRILPYAHEEKVVQYLVNVLSSLVDKGQGTGDKGHGTRDKRQEFRDMGQRTLIMPIAANKPDYAYCMPRVFQMAEDGTMMCIHALLSLDLTKYDHIYITTLRTLDERYSIGEMLRLQFKIKGIQNAEVVVLDEPTTSQPETIYRTIQQKQIIGSIFIKDADCNFVGEDTKDNAIVVYPLEQLDWVNPKNKSYVNVDDQYYITNIIEKRIVSHYFTAGGYSFADVTTFCRYYERFAGQKGLYLSHLIYTMLLDQHTFRPVMAKAYEDFEFKY